eukprot:GDKI01044134.1.p1 GENE.GDKI01044134.1~~GDKI01044134.1.p1  ORF type:complete len:139 (-),score=18.54 GDKI01044134.1:33-449(-)
MLSLDDNRKLGIGLLALGMLLSGLGIVLFFDRALLALGNMAFLAGICFMLGFSKTAKFFLKRDKLQGTAFFFGGFIIIVWGWGIIGLLLELYGVWKLFSAFLPNVLQAVRMTPLGFIFDLPVLSTVASWIYDQRRLPL